MKGAALFVCSRCDAQSPKWSGRCVSCGSWGTIAAEAPSSTPMAAHVPASPVRRAADVDTADVARISAGSPELDRVLGGGVVPGSLILLAGEPGIGKSTLVLHMAEQAAGPVLYAAGEESPAQIMLRVRRLGLAGKQLVFTTHMQADAIVATVSKEKPALCIIDSMQTVRDNATGEPGSVAETRSAIAKLAALAKEHHITTFVIGQVTKDGSVAGPKTLEHLVDVVLALEGHPHESGRILRASKNRFGSHREVGLFQMTPTGLHDAATPPPVSDRPATPGTASAVVREGSRTLLVEVQALTNRTAFGYPVRRAEGFDTNRLNLLLAVLERRAGVRLSDQDVYVNVVGGLQLTEPAADLAVALAVVSAALDIAIPRAMGLFGEIGLGGEIRPVHDTSERANDAKRFGLTTLLHHPQVATVQDAISEIKKTASERIPRG